MEEYLDLKEAFLTQISELEALVSQNQNNYQEFIRTRILAVMASQEEVKQILSSKNVEISSELNSKHEEIITLQ